MKLNERHIILSPNDIAMLVSTALSTEPTDMSDSEASRRLLALFSPHVFCGVNSNVGSDLNEDFVKLFVDPTIIRSLEVHKYATGTKEVVAGFRSVSIVFVSLLFPFDLARLQTVILCFMQALTLYGGVYQQFAVDDKGQTLLAVFGLE
ncbi:hypothetical protein HK101_001142, partial [Irineochytrium annulatum]